MTITVSQIDYGTPEYDEAVALRYEVLRRPLGLEYTPEQLATEWSDIHLAAMDDTGVILGILILTPLTDKEIKMRQVAVAPHLQSKGIGSKLVSESEIVAKSLGFKKITLHARHKAIPFYQRLDYQQIGNMFEEVNIPHFKMEKVL